MARRSGVQGVFAALLVCPLSGSGNDSGYAIQLLVMAPATPRLASGRSFSRFLRGPLTLSRVFSMTRYARALLDSLMAWDMGELTMRHGPDAKLGSTDARAVLPTPDGTHRRACYWYRRSHRVSLVYIFLCLISFAPFFF